MRAARASVPSGDHSCSTLGRAAGDGGGLAAPPSARQGVSRCASSGCLRTFFPRRRVFVPRQGNGRWRCWRRARLVRVGRRDLLPVQQRSSVRLLHHYAAAAKAAAAAVDDAAACGSFHSVVRRDNSPLFARIGVTKRGAGAGSWFPAASPLVFYVLVSVSHPLTSCSPSACLTVLMTYPTSAHVSILLFT